MDNRRIINQKAMNQIRETLSDQDKYRTFLKDGLIEEQIVTPMIEKGHRNEAELIRAVLEMILIGNANLIEEYSESKLEQLFFNAINLISGMFFSPFFLRFTPSPPSVNKYISSLIEEIEYSRQLEKEFLKLPDAEPKEFKQFLDWLADKGTISKELASKLHFFQITYNVLGFQNAYHFTMQAKFPDIKIQGRSIRTDLLIWLPFDNSFRLIVECDGFAYHGDKNSFTTDRQRDRVLKSHGYDVFRFSGPEIYKDPPNSAKELVEYLNNLRSSEK